MTESESSRMSQHTIEPTMQSAKTLFKAVSYALLIALVILTVAILPAEYGIDPTGLGSKWGLTTFAHTDSAIIQPQSDDSNLDPVSPASNNRTDSVDITVPAGKGLEYKFDIAKDKTLHYTWTTKEGQLFFDFHGEPKGDTTGYFVSYTISTASDVRGSLTASFDGSHGWYWKNNGSRPVIVTLLTEGEYDIIGIK